MSNRKNPFGDLDLALVPLENGASCHIIGNLDSSLLCKLHVVVVMA
jgi:hypothetical protein